MNKVLKISIVEDDPVIRNLTSMRVTKLGHTVHTQFGSGESALAGLPKSLPDIAIMDIDLGGDLDGIDVALRLQETYSLPFIFVSSHRDKETIDRVKMVKGAEFIVKPFTDDSLRIAIDLALDKYRALRHYEGREELRGMLLDQFFGAIIATDTHGVVTYINERGREMTRWRGAIDGLTHFREIVTIVDAASGSLLENVADRILSERKIFWLPPDTNLIALDKTSVPVMGSASPLIDSSGTVRGMIVLLYLLSNPQYLEFRGR